MYKKLFTRCRGVAGLWKTNLFTIPTRFQHFACPHHRTQMVCVHKDRTWRCPDRPHVCQTPIIKWECDWNREVKSNECFKQFLASCKMVESLSLSDAFFGGGTNAVDTHHVATRTRVNKSNTWTWLSCTRVLTRYNSIPLVIPSSSPTHRTKTSMRTVKQMRFLPIFCIIRSCSSDIVLNWHYLYAEPAWKIWTRTSLKICIIVLTPQRNVFLDVRGAPLNSSKQ